MWRNLLLLVVLAAIVVMRIFPPAATHAPAAANAPSHVSAPAPAASGAVAPTSAAHAGFGADVGFRSQERLDEHWAKHGGEFASLGIRDEAAYLHAAQALRDAPAGGEILEIVRAGDGVVSRFDKRTGAFLAFDDRGRIRTFFRPRDGERYFERQANRLPENP